MTQIENRVQTNKIIIGYDNIRPLLGKERTKEIVRVSKELGLPLKWLYINNKSVPVLLVDELKDWIKSLPKGRLSARIPDDVWEELWKPLLS